MFDTTFLKAAEEDAASLKQQQFQDVLGCREVTIRARICFMCSIVEGFLSSFSSAVQTENPTAKMAELYANRL